MLPGLFVIARSSTFTYKGKAARLKDVGKELRVKYVWRAEWTEVNITSPDGIKALGGYV